MGLAKAKAKNVALHLPTDFITADAFAADANVGHATVAAVVAKLTDAAAVANLRAAWRREAASRTGTAGCPR